MSHFFTIVIVPEDTKDIEGAVRDLLAPFDENLNVPEYETDCWCVGLEARNYAHEQANKAYDFDKLRNEYWAIPEDSRPEWLDFAKDYIEGRDKRYEDELKNHPLKDKPNPECEECNGTGRMKTTYNPKSKWDWYRIGGRWDGVIRNIDVESDDGGFNFGSQHETLEMNTAPVSEILENKIVPFAIVTPDGEWYERGNMGWWGMFSNEKDDWEEVATQVLEKYAEGYVGVGVDCHI